MFAGRQTRRIFCLQTFRIYAPFALRTQTYIIYVLQALAFVKIYMKTERGNALLGIVVIIIVLLVGGIFYWNSYQMQLKKDAEIRKQAEIAQTQIINQPEDTTSTTTSTSTSPAVQLDTGNNGKVIPITVGQVFVITLGNPGDGGYLFDNPEYDTSLLHLMSHVHNPPTNSALGNYGTDAWQFTTLATGTTDVTITASRPWKTDDAVNIFKASLSIK